MSALAFAIFTTIPQIIIAVYFVAFQGFFAPIQPFEVGINFLYLLFLLPEMVFAKRAFSKMIRYQAAAFFLNMQEEPNDGT